MPQLDFFMYQNVVVYATIVFFILSYNIYLLLIKIFKILKTRLLLNKVYDELSVDNEIVIIKSEKTSNKFSLLTKEYFNINNTNATF